MDFSFAAAKELAGDKHSGIKLMAKPKHISLPWSFMGKQLRGVKLILDRSLRLYSSELDAIPLAYSQIHRVQKHPYVIEDQPHCHFDVVVEWAVFKPSIGAKIKAEIREITNPSVVSCLIHGIFNASVLTSQFKEKQKIAVGQLIEFKVESCEVNRKMVNLRGKLTRIIGSAPQFDTSPAAIGLPESTESHVRFDEESQPTKTKRGKRHAQEAIDESVEVVKVKRSKAAKVKKELLEAADLSENIPVPTSQEPEPETKRKKKSEKLKAETKVEVVE